MKKIKILFILLIPLLTGCYNYREINDLAIVTALSIGKTEEEFKITVQVINSKKETDASTANQPDFITYTNTGTSIQETLRYMILESPKKIYGAHLQILILDESLAKDDISAALDFFFRDPEIRKVFFILIGKQEELLNVITPLDTISSQNITESLESSNKYLGLSNLITFHDLMNIYLGNKQELAIPSIELKGTVEEGEEDKNIQKTQTDTTLFISDIAVFKDTKMLGYLTNEESIAFNMIKNNITHTIIHSDYNDGYITHEILEFKSNIEANPKKNKVTIKINGRSAITEVNTKEKLSTEKNIKEIQKKLNKDIEKLIKDSIKNINKKYNSDIYGFEELFYKTDYKYYNKIKDKWYEEIFNNIEIEVKSNITIQEKGNILGGIHNDKKQ